MLTSIIKQITQERHDDKSNANQLGTNQIHTLSNIRGFRKLGRNMTFGTYPYPLSVPVQPTKETELVNNVLLLLLDEPKAPELEAFTAAQETVQETAQEAAAQEAAAPEPIPSPVIAPVREAPIPKGMSRAAMRKKQREEEAARQRAQAQAQPSAPQPIEVASTLSE